MDPATEEDFSSLKLRNQETLDLLQVDKELFKPVTHAFLVDCLTNTSSDNHSRYMLMLVLERARQGNWSLLARDSVCNNKSVSERDLERARNRKMKLTDKQRQIIKEKKVRRMKQMEGCQSFELDMFPGNFKLLTKELGSDAYKFARSENTYLELQNAINTENMKQNKQLTAVKLWGSADSVAKVAKALNKAARNIQREKNEEREVSV